MSKKIGSTHQDKEIAIVERVSIYDTVQARLANLLAEENLRVIFTDATTANFDLINRVLTIPKYVESMPVDVITAFTAHEIGHAKFTPTQGWHDAVLPIQPSGKRRIDRVKKSYLNVLEDIRIEKKVLALYKGLAGVFANSYRYLYDHGFFGTSDELLGELLLIDRINLCFKTRGYHYEAFDQEENRLVSRAYDLDSWDEVVDLAAEIMEYDAKKAFFNPNVTTGKIVIKDKGGYEPTKEDNSSSKTNEFSPSEGDDDLGVDEVDDNSDSKYDPYSNSDDNKLAGSGDCNTIIPENLPDFTDSSFSRNMREFIANNNKGVHGLDKKSVVIHVGPDVIPELEDVLVQYNTLIELIKNRAKGSLKWNIDDDDAWEIPDDLKMSDKPSFYKKVIKAYGAVDSRHKKYVSHMVQLFEMKKRANIHAKSSEHKSGLIDLTKLPSYKFSEDIFKRVVTKPIGKNHAVVVFVDMSGSMKKVVRDVLDQAVAMALFCRRVNIPFRIYGFSSLIGTNRAITSIKYPKMGGEQIYEWGRLGLFELFSNEMTAKEFAVMAGVVGKYKDLLIDDRVIYMGGTPITPVTLLMPQIHKLMNKNNNRVVYMMFSDGADTGSEVIYSPYVASSLYDTVNNYIEFSFNGVKRTYETRGTTISGISMHYMKVYTGAVIVGYYAVDSVRNLTLHGDDKVKFKNQGVLETNSLGYERYFIVNKSKFVSTGESNITGKTINGLASSMVKGNALRSSEKIFLNRFMEYLA